jgi:hypothetical protein
MNKKESRWIIGIPIAIGVAIGVAENSTGKAVIYGIAGFLVDMIVAVWIEKRRGPHGWAR